ncbi:MAG: leucine-rich repeat protein, partial [Prevotella sp.]|nr:leucine-rich repeat protein [Prevotella sp.]
MKKKLSLLLFALAAMAVHAQSFLSGGIRYEVTGDNTVKVVTFNGGTNINGNAANYTGAISIPAKVTSEENVTYNVTEIGNQAFRAAQITAITIPASVTYVGDMPFYECSNLSKVTLSDGTDPITFNNYSSRTFSHGSYSVYMGRNVERENYTYSPFPKATAVTIGNKVTEVGDGMFNGCTKVASLKIGTGVTSIGVNAFNSVGSEAGSLVFTAGPNVTSFGNACFAYSKISGAFVIPEGTQTVPYEMFRGSSLTEITIPASVTYVGDMPFYECSNLSKVTLSDGTDPITFNNYSSRTFSHGSYSVYMG